MERVRGWSVGQKIFRDREEARIFEARSALSAWFEKIAGVDGVLTPDKLLAAIGRDPVTVAKSILATAPAGTIRPRGPREASSETGANGGKRRGRPPKAPPVETAQPQEATA